MGKLQKDRRMDAQFKELGKTHKWAAAAAECSDFRRTVVEQIVRILDDEQGWDNGPSKPLLAHDSFMGALIVSV